MNAGNMYKDFVKFGHVVFKYASAQTNRDAYMQTDGHTDTPTRLVVSNKHHTKTARQQKDGYQRCNCIRILQEDNSNAVVQQAWVYF